MKTKALIQDCSEEHAFKNLEHAAWFIVKRFRVWPFSTKLNELRLPLLQLKRARKKKR